MPDEQADEPASQIRSLCVMRERPLRDWTKTEEEVKSGDSVGKQKQRRH
jgi:hypothetical protein